MAFVHPFDDPDVVAGQGSLGLELLEDVPDLAKVVVPVGGGGLASGVAIAVKSARPEVEVRRRAHRRRPALDHRRRHRRQAARASSPRALLREWLDGEVVVEDEDAAEAMVVLLERCKLVVEGAGAVGVAALLRGQVAPAARGTTVAILSGGNVDAGPAALDRPPARDAGGPPARRAQPRPRPAGQARRAARLGRARGRQRRRRLARARGLRPPRARDRRGARARDPRREHADTVHARDARGRVSAQPLE